MYLYLILWLVSEKIGMGDSTALLLLLCSSVLLQEYPLPVSLRPGEFLRFVSTPANLCPHHDPF